MPYNNYNKGGNMSYEIELFNSDHDYEFEYDTGYGVVGGDVYLEVEPVFTDERFDAYNGAGNLQMYGNAHALTGVKVLQATFYAIGNNGVELGEYDITDQYEKYISDDQLLDKLVDLGAGEEY